MAIPFGQRSLTSLTFEDVKAFVALDLDEDEHLEYKAASSTTATAKQDFDHSFCATVVAFANGGGGLILFGVTNGGPGRPREIVGEPLVNGKMRNLTQSVVDSCTARIEPTLLLHVRSFTIPVGELHEGSQILLVRVPVGSCRPTMCANTASTSAGERTEIGALAWPRSRGFSICVARWGRQRQPSGPSCSGLFSRI